MTVFRSLVCVVTILGVVLCTAGVATAAPKPKPDLAVRAVTHGASVKYGQRTKVTFQIRRLGTVAAPASTAGVFVSKDRRRGAGDVRVGTVAISRIAGSSKHRNAAVRFAWPASLGAGTRYVVVCADIANRISEQREGNNCATSGIVRVQALPTISFGAAPATIYEGTEAAFPMQVTGTIRRTFKYTVRVTAVTAGNDAAVEFNTSEISYLAGANGFGQTVYLTAKLDGHIEGDERYRATIVSTDEDGAIGSPASVEFTVAANNA